MLRFLRRVISALHLDSEATMEVPSPEGTALSDSKEVKGARRQPARRNISSDRAIDNPDDDRFGFGETIVPRLARVAAEWPSEHGVVVGLYGSWGAGKSSVLNLLARRWTDPVQMGAPVPKVILVRFTPMFYDNHAALVQSFFRNPCAGSWTRWSEDEKVG